MRKIKKKAGDNIQFYKDFFLDNKPETFYHDIDLTSSRPDLKRRLSVTPVINYMNDASDKRGAVECFYHAETHGVFWSVKTEEIKDLYAIVYGKANANLTIRMYVEDLI